MQPDRPDWRERFETRPFAFCCAQGGGDVESCSCAEPDHGVALFPRDDREDHQEVSNA